MLFPRDGLAGGTWVAATEDGHVAVLLNGAWEKHEPDPPYRMSRGLVLLDLLATPEPAAAFGPFDFSGIEPFTLLMAGHGGLVVGRWDGKKAITERKDPAMPLILSSSTLYPAPVRARRAEWFRDWLETEPSADAEKLIAFHRFTGDGDPENDLLMKRGDGIFTNSITVLDCAPDEVAFHYLDLRTDVRCRQSMPLLTPITTAR